MGVVDDRPSPQSGPYLSIGPCWLFWRVWNILFIWPVFASCIFLFFPRHGTMPEWDPFSLLEVWHNVLYFSGLVGLEHVFGGGGYHANVA